MLACPATVIWSTLALSASARYSLLPTPEHPRAPKLTSSNEEHRPRQGSRADHGASPLANTIKRDSVKRAHSGGGSGLSGHGFLSGAAVGCDRRDRQRVAIKHHSGLSAPHGEVQRARSTTASQI